MIGTTCRMAVQASTMVVEQTSSELKSDSPTL